jgi:hypothetical protein
MGVPMGGLSGGFWSDGLRQPHPAPLHPGDAGLVRRRLAAQDPRIRIRSRWLFPWRFRRCGWPRPGGPLWVRRERWGGMGRQRPAQGAEQRGHPRHRRDHRRHLRLGEQILELGAEVRRTRHQPDEPGVPSGQRILWRRGMRARGTRLGARLGAGGAERPERPGGVAGGQRREPASDPPEPAADQEDQEPRYRVPHRPRGGLIQTLEDRGEAVREVRRGWWGGGAGHAQT